MNHALVARDVSKAYRGRTVVNTVSLQAARGEITAILGPNGAGKTTFVECCAGLRQPDAGSITVLGKDRGTRAHADWLRRHVGVMVQEGGLPQAPTAGAVLNHVAALRGVRGQAVPLADRLGLTEHLSTSVRRLSGGQRQRVAVGCALLGQPDLLFLDEPSAGVDPHSRREMWALLEEERARGAAIILTTHLMDEAESLADRIVVLQAGRVIANGSVTDLTAGSIVVVTPTVPAQIIAECAARVGGQPGEEGTLLIPTPSVSIISDLTSYLTQTGYGHCQLQVRARSLENVFLTLTSAKVAPTSVATEGGLP